MKKHGILYHLREIVWPCLERESQRQISMRKDHLEDVLNNIKTVRWRSLETVLEEIRRLASREDERRKTAETKATIYLAVLAAIVPLSASFIKELVVYLESMHVWPFVMLASLSLLAVAYLLAAGVWTFKTIEVRGYHRVEVEGLVRLNTEREVELALCRDILTSVMKNRVVVNKKVTNLRMAHAFLVRLFVALVLLSAFPLAVTVANRFPSWCIIVYKLTQSTL